MNTRSKERMIELTVVYWRDIPAQVLAGKGRRAEKRVLPERFEQAIDRAAMAAGTTGTDAYLADWRKETVQHAGTDAAELATAEAARLDADYDTPRLKALIDNQGYA